jgi:hypothetical protein
MSIITSQQLARYYEQYKSTDVTFNRQVVAGLGLVAKGVYLKIQDQQLPCMVFSSSMSSARVLAVMPAGVMLALKQANNRMTLHWCFRLPEKIDPITFFVTCRAAGFTPYAARGPDAHFVSLDFTQRPADDLILLLGSLLEANANAHRRRHERIVLTPETIKKLGLESRDAELIVGTASFKCVLRDISFGGAKVAVSGSEKTFTSRSVSLKLALSEELREMTIPAAVRRVEEIGGRKDILAVSMEYSSEPPMGYKLLINSYLSATKKTVETGGEAPTPPDSPAASPGADG